MASAVIHIAVASEVNKHLNRNNSELFIGTIAPDIAKLIGETKTKSHFLVQDDNIPDLDKFLDKYKNKLENDFVLGYYIHLYTDYLWYKYFTSELVNNNKIVKKDGTIVKLNGNMEKFYIYNDYTNLNIQLIEKYDLDLKIFYNELPNIQNIITEIPIDRLDLLIEQAGIIIAKTKENKAFIFDITDVCKFIETATQLILAAINENS